jgi:hypothetical protein
VEDLDRIDATGLKNGKPVELTPDRLERHWGDLTGEDASRTYLAFWSLVASPKQAVPFLRGRLRGPPASASAEQLEQWVRELDDRKFKVRERAYKLLEEHVEAAAGHLERVLAGSPSAEVRTRVERLLKGRKDREGQIARIDKAVRVLEYAESAEARKCLEEFAKEGGDPRLRGAAGAALKRLDTAGRK